VLPTFFITGLLIVAAFYFALVNSPETRWLLVALFPTALAGRNWWRVTGLNTRDEVAASVHPDLR